MPYKIVKQGNRYAIVRKDTGKVVGHSDSRKKAHISIYYRESGDKGKKS